MAIAAAIIAGIFAIGGVIVSSSISSSDMDEAKNESLKLANISRQDKLKIDAANEKLEKYRLRQTDRELAFRKSEAAQSKKEREIERNYNMQQTQFNNALGFINSNETLKGNFLSLIKR
jgi:hypothetical protein